MAEKDNEEKSAIGAKKRSHQLRLEFWDQALQAVRAADFERWQNINPSRESWLVSGLGVSGVSLNLSFVQHEARTEA